MPDQRPSHPVDILVRADRRWANRHGGDPTDLAYLEHLAAAVPAQVPATQHLADLERLQATHERRLGAAVADARAGDATRRDADQRLLRDAQQDRDLYRDLLARLVVAVTGQPCPPGADLPGRAAAACGQLAQQTVHATSSPTAAAAAHPGHVTAAQPFPPTRTAATARDPHTTVGDTAGAPQPPPGAA